MVFRICKKEGRIISGTETQKDVINYLHKYYGLSKKFLLDFIQAARKNNYIWDSFKTDYHEITIYVVKGNMFLGIEKLQ